jgi:hypothetical protein
MPAKANKRMKPIFKMWMNGRVGFSKGKLNPLAGDGFVGTHYNQVADFSTARSYSFCYYDAL